MVVLSIGLGSVYLGPLMSIGGLSNSYRPHDNDAILMAIAANAAPIIAALERYRQTLGAFPDPSRPSDVATLATYLPHDTKITDRGDQLALSLGRLEGWSYSRVEGNCPAYSLSFKLGWDPRL